jgi:hypothetical protein
VAALSRAKELLGGELRDVFDAHPPKPAPEGEEGGLLAGMQVWAPEGRGAAWPYGVDWYRDTYPMPYWVRQQQQQQDGEQQQDGGGGGGGGGSSGAAAPAVAAAAAAGGGSSSGSSSTAAG